MRMLGARGWWRRGTCSCCVDCKTKHAMRAEEKREWKAQAQHEATEEYETKPVYAVRIT